MIVLSGIIIWAAVQLRAPTGGVGGVTPLEGGVPSLIPDDDQDEVERIFAGRDARALLELRVLALPDNAQASTIEDFGAAAVEGGAVTILNLWASWCEPCKAELPGLKRAFVTAKRGANGDKARFVPMLVDSTVSIEDARIVYDKLGGPQPAAFIADAGLGGGVRQQLVGLELLAKDADIDLPTTLILDCHRRLRWHHTGVLREADFAELGRVLSELQGEIGTPICEPLRLKKKARSRGHKRPRMLGAGDSAEARTVADDTVDTEGGADAHGDSASGGGRDHRPRSVCDRNDVCEAKRGETDINCPSDCKTVM